MSAPTLRSGWSPPDTRIPLPGGAELEVAETQGWSARGRLTRLAFVDSNGDRMTCVLDAEAVTLLVAALVRARDGERGR